MVIVSCPKLPSAFVPFTVMVLLPTARGTDIDHPWLQGNGPAANRKHCWTVRVPVPLPPAELLQVTAVTVNERDPERSTVAWEVGNVGFAVGNSIVTNPGISCGASSSLPPPQALSPASASTATSNCFRQLFVLSTCTPLRNSGTRHGRPASRIHGS